MLRPSIRKRILAIAVGLIVLMAITSVLSTVMTRKVAHQLDELSTKYVEAYGHLARMNVRSLEQALALRRMVIARMQTPPDEAGFAERQKTYEAKGQDIDEEAKAARKLINAIIEDTSTASDNAGLGRIDTRIENANGDLRRYMREEYLRLLPLLEARKFTEAQAIVARADQLRDEFNQKVEDIRKDMLTQVRSDAVVTMRDQQKTIVISAILTGLAAILGLMFAIFISTGITRPVRRLLEGTRAVEAGRLDGSIDVTTRDEIGQLTSAFNNMVEQLRHKEKMRETFGRYIDPRVVAGLIDRQAQTVTDGERRVMTVLFCDMKGFTSLSTGMTPQGLVKVMNHYLSTMSGPIRNHHGIIDKYIGDAIMAYWGPPFNEDGEQARLACLAAIDMARRGTALRTELPELLGVRTVPSDCDVRIGVATGEVLVGSIGSEFMMSYTVMGDAVNLASRLEGANKAYGSHCLVSAPTIAAAGDGLAFREIDRLVVVGQSQPETVFEIIGREDELTSEQVSLLDSYSKGLAAYRERRWDDARHAFSAGLEAVPADGPSGVFIKRIGELQASPPAADWDGAWRLDEK
ncbi:HAMP domain-containing protein [Bradyrhizobium sp. AUGA SZCCT0240]|uniref:adenylate/guanylate cyclase domain-containing protein n=1 Tax=unclassified Bradyrhizobium TaxID=2631580 RepID=UPI001BAB2809|nr:MULTISPECIES: adenylate/guanylate cyclase domain-containing protein [unclassified Bradyrhizobium]MBR1195502.1 HAMP domain-containing protein [Bradyrhizobium sp. AUGA SZCCT0158]MBR1244809.1 HAMP domain-containing protein [Bradyrhizobium sp. AUGA SZCCT0274]MBR1258640.1 HAMP domain-containing protein [Bradyrhizobium sp. AUGA SZCCT0240]